ncbi:hypothetical protein ACRPH4_05630 [Pantoea allii]|uniref:hypothetical protein n=1 Tax=Pantoea allii TaxID=574096 RepID=UPI003D78C9E5
MKSLNQRRVIYCLPFIYCNKKTKIGNVTIKPLFCLSESESCKGLIEGLKFDKKSSVIEIDDFNSGDFFTYSTYNKIKDSLEVLKISYFFEYPSSLMSIDGFIGNETFECHPVIELDFNLSAFGVEHKINFSNGMTNFNLSLDVFLNYRVGFYRSFSLNITDISFDYYSLFESVSKDSNLIDLIRIYNKCWGLYSSLDFSDKALYSKISIELLSKRYGKNGNLVEKTFSSFFNYITDLIDEFEFKNPLIKNIYKLKVSPHMDTVISVFNDYFKSLNSERKKIAHEGKVSGGFINVTPYLIVFPAMLLVLEGSEYLREKDIYRFIFMLSLFTFNIEKWQKIDFESQPIGKRTNLDNYVNFSTCYPRYLEINTESSLAMMIGFENWLEENDILDLAKK